MHAALRPYATVGVALVGASAIAVTPVVVTPPDVKVPAVSSAAVQLTANPIEYYSEVFGTTWANASAIFEHILANPAPILTQVIRNQTRNWGAVGDELLAFVETVGATAGEQVTTSFESAFADLGDLNVVGAVNTLLNLPIEILGTGGGFVGLLTNVLPLATALQEAFVAPWENVAAAVDAVFGVEGTTALIALGGMIGPIISGTGAVGQAIQNIIDPVLAGDVVETVYALINAPATVADGWLNGGYGPPIDILGLFELPFSGIISGNVDAVFGDMAGPIQTLLNIRDTIARAIGWEPVSPNRVAAFTGDEIVADAQLRTAAPESAALPDPDGTNIVAISVPAETEATEDEASDKNEEAKDDADGEGQNAERTASKRGQSSTADKGKTDLTGGNKVTPGKVGSDSERGGERSLATTPKADANDNAGAGDAGDDDSGSDE